MKKSKLVSLGIVAALVGSLLTGCGGSASTETTAAGTAASGETVAAEAEAEVAEPASSDAVLSVSIWDSYQEPGIKQILDDFTAKTGIQTELSVITWTEYWTILETGAQGGSLPDVFWMHSNESERYMSNDMLLDLTAQIEASADIDPANYPSDIWNLYMHSDKSYAIPKDIDTIAIWYNKAMFDEAGIPYPTADWTWEEMGEIAKQLTKEDGSQYGLAIRNDGNQEGYYNMIYGHGGTVITDDKTQSGFSDPKTVEAMNLFASWIDEGIMPSIETMAENDPPSLFQSGTVAMVAQGSWMLSAYKDNEYTVANADIVELPKDSETGRRVSIYNGLGWAAAANTDYPEEAWKLIEYLGSEEAQIKQAELGVTMSAYTGTSDAWVNSADFNLQAYMNMMDDMVIRPYSRSTVTWENENNEILKSVYTGDISMDEACSQMAEQMNEKLAEE